MNTASPTAHPSKQMADLLALGQSRRPWDYLDALRECPDEVANAAPVRFLLAANLGSLAFADAACTVLDELEQAGTEGLDTASLRRSLAGRPATRRKNPHRLWQTADGKVLWRESGRFVGFDAAAAASTALKATNLIPDRQPDEHLPPLLIAGLSSPVLLNAVLRSTRPLANGYTPLIIVVEPDQARADRALAFEPLACSEEEPEPAARILLLTGIDALAHLDSWLHERIECALPRRVIAELESRSELTEQTQSILDRRAQQQKEECDRAAATIERSTQSARDCIERIRRGEQLRVLVAVSRHSNFVRHSASDIIEALRALGHQPTLLTEPDAHSIHSRLAYLRAYAATDPDLVLLINHPRWRLGGALPQRAPSLCWVQDAMPHLFEANSTTHGPHDFLVGYRFPELTERFGYHPERVIEATLPVSAMKFHDQPVDPEIAARFTCEVAFATRQSETPQRMVSRLEQQAGTANASMIRSAFDLLDSRFAKDDLAFIRPELDQIARDALADAGHRTDDPTTIDRAVRLVVLPLADRMLRHRVVEWTANICDQRGWRFALYGSGWEHHPTLSRFARGELEHGEHLRAAYRCARVNLSVSAHSLVHQRITECLLSGGRMLCYRRRTDLLERRWQLIAHLARSCQPDAHASDGSPLYGSASYPEVAEHLNRWQRFGLDEPQRRGDALRIDARYLDHFRALDCGQHNSGSVLLGSTLIDRASFSTPDELETMLARAIEHTEAFDRDIQPARALASSACDARPVLQRVLQTLAARLGPAPTESP